MFSIPSSLSIDLSVTYQQTSGRRRLLGNDLSTLNQYFTIITKHLPCTNPTAKLGSHIHSSCGENAVTLSVCQKHGWETMVDQCSTMKI